MSSSIKEFTIDTYKGKFRKVAKKDRENKSYCKYCNSELGYFNSVARSGKEIVHQYFSKQSKELDGKEYKRVVCIECFYKRFNRLPKSPNMVNYDMEFLMDIPQSILVKYCKRRAVTIETMTEIYGEEEGLERFNAYREKQSYSNSLQHFKDTKGWSKEDFDNYNKGRAVTLENLQKKYGKEEGSKRFNEYREKQSYSNKLPYFIEKYGEVEGESIYLAINKSKGITLENLQKKYGKEEGYKRRVKFVSNCVVTLEKMTNKYGDEEGGKRYNKWRDAFYGNGSAVSKISQKLFWAIYNRLPDKWKEKCKFGEHKYEFNCYDKAFKRSYFYDFVIKDLNICIEYNGEHCHVNEKLKELDVVAWENWKSPYRDAKSRDEQIEYDKIKKQFLYDNYGIKTYYVWNKWYSKLGDKAVEIILRDIEKRILDYERKRNLLL